MTGAIFADGIDEDSLMSGHYSIRPHTRWLHCSHRSAAALMQRPKRDGNMCSGALF
jgi:hypothetical protein